MTHPTPRAAFALCLFTLGATAAADPLTWRTEYATARKEAEKANMPLLVVVGTDQCFYCRKQETVTFVDRQVTEFVAGKFIPLKLDANKEPEFARAMRVTVYPTTVIAGPDGKVYAYLAGYQAPDQFLELSKKAVALLPPADKPFEKAAKLAALTKPEPKQPEAVKAVGPAEAPKGASGAKELLASVKALHTADKFAESLELADVLTAQHPGTPEAEEAANVAFAIKADPDKLAVVVEQQDERTVTRYVVLAEAWAAKGRGREAIALYEKAVKLAPHTRSADTARAKLQKLYAEYPIIRAER
jgi:thioredoxin-related protein